MGFNVTISEAAVAYGIHDLSAAIDDAMIFGEVVSIETSWGDGEPDFGTLSLITASFSKGFKLTIGITLTSATSVTISNFQLLDPANQSLITFSGQIEISATDDFETLEDVVVFGGADALYGNSASNWLEGWGGDDWLYGGGGIDTAVFSGSYSQYVNYASGSSRVVNGPDGSDTLVDVERLRFDDYTLAFDSNTAQAYRLYQAAFNRTPDIAGLDFQVNALDQGWALVNISQNFIDSPEFSATHGSLNNVQFINLLYQNVLHRNGEQSGVDYHVADLAAGVSRAQILANFSESPENQTALIGVTSAGMLLLS